MLRQWLFAWAAVGCLQFFATATSFAADPLVVHEWGTFTALQDETGKALTGINTDDEPVPPFVHNLNPFGRSSGALPQFYASRGAPERHPMVTLRLETPVLYFHPPKSMPLPFDVDVSVKFNAGWLTEFYPQATSVSSGSKTEQPEFESLTPKTVSELKWTGLHVGGDAAGPKTDAAVWLSPRKVDAANVSIDNKGTVEHERYVFYRGLGNFDAPLVTNLDRQGNKLSVHANFADVAKDDASLPLGPMWLVHVRQDRSSAFRTIEAGRATRDRKATIASCPVNFADADYSADNLQKLRKAMHAALVADGLFEDEATAMLETWQNAYYRSPGLRLFCLVPQPWTDDHLPLKLSREAQIRRVMVARIELIDADYRTALAELSKAKISTMAWIDKVPRNDKTQSFFDGHSNFGDLGVEIPADYKLYLRLGRFRNALLIAEERAHPSPSLTEFINNYGLYQYRHEQ